MASNDLEKQHQRESTKLSNSDVKGDPYRLREQLIRAVHSSTFECPKECLTAEVSKAPLDRLGEVRIDKRNVSICLNDPNSISLDSALSTYGWEAGTIRLSGEGSLIISIWERQ